MREASPSGWVRYNYVEEIVSDSTEGRPVILVCRFGHEYLC